jgi:hypothetical protein
MTVLPRGKVQCDRCRTVIVLKAKRSDQLGGELLDAGWRARPIKGGRYQHACELCSDELIKQFDDWCALEHWRPAC